MQATMMDTPLVVSHLLDRAARLFGRIEIVSRTPQRSVVRHTYADLHRRAGALARALIGEGLAHGDRVATLMWNHHAHLEAVIHAGDVNLVQHVSRQADGQVGEQDAIEVRR